jgi:hypothetical protein
VYVSVISVHCTVCCLFLGGGGGRGGGQMEKSLGHQTALFKDFFMNHQPILQKMNIQYAFVLVK